MAEMATLVLALAASAGTVSSVSSEYPGIMRNFTFSGSDSIPQATDCAVRAAAWAYGKKLQPTKGAFRALFDALQLGACGVAPPPPGLGDEWAPPVAAEGGKGPGGGGRTLFVLPSSASRQVPLATDTFSSVEQAVTASRALAKPLTIALREGLHFMGAPLQLGPADSGLTIRNADNERAVLSGGVNLTTAWKPSTACSGCWEASLKGQVTNVPGLRRNGVREIRARYPNHDPESNAVISGEYLVRRQVGHGQHKWRSMALCGCAEHERRPWSMAPGRKGHDVRGGRQGLAGGGLADGDHDERKQREQLSQQRHMDG
eukprot:COSAG05_NODE_316_length_11576_cov_16.975342_1_plen_317_part_00